MSQQRSSNPLSSWLAPLIPGSWIESKALHIRRTEAVSLVGYGTVMSLFCNTASEATTLKQLLLLWGCAEAAFYVYQKWRYIASTQAHDHLLQHKTALDHQEHSCQYYCILVAVHPLHLRPWHTCSRQSLIFLGSKSLCMSLYEVVLRFACFRSFACHHQISSSV